MNKTLKHPEKSHPRPHDVYFNGVGTGLHKTQTKLLENLLEIEREDQNTLGSLGNNTRLNY